MSLKDEVLNVIVKTLDVDKEDLAEDKKLYDSIGVDSTEIVELTVSLGKHFGVKIEAGEISKFSTPVDIVRVIEQKKGN